MKRALAVVVLVLSSCHIPWNDDGDVKPVPSPKPSTIPATTVDLDVLPSLELKSAHLPPAWASAAASSRPGN